MFPDVYRIPNDIARRIAHENLINYNNYAILQTYSVWYFKRSQQDNLTNFAIE